MTTQQLQARHEKGEKILDMIKGAENSLDFKGETLSKWKNDYSGFRTIIAKMEHRIDITTRALSRLRSYYYSTMEIVPTESIGEIAKEVAKGTEMFFKMNGSYASCETFESEDYRLDFVFHSHFFQGELEEISNLEIAELYHNRRKYTAEEIDGLKLLLLEELTRKGKGN
jgi:hypothetical protein